jgi:hypothetical protein
MRRSKYKTEVTLKYFNVEVLHEMICAFLEIKDDLILILDEEDYIPKLTTNFELKVNTPNKPTNSKIESIVLSYYDTKEKVRDLILKHPFAFNILDKDERVLFHSIYEERLNDQQIIERYPEFYSEKIKKMRKTIIIKFALKLGLNTYMDAFMSL